MKNVCSIDDCQRPHAARGLCNGHYHQARKRGDFIPHIYPQTCTWNSCPNIYYSSGLCRNHYDDKALRLAMYDAGVGRNISRKGETRDCEWCGISFYTTFILDQKTCSKRCARLLLIKDVPSKKISVPCVWCGTKIEKYIARLPKNVFCSRTCFGAYKSDEFKKYPEKNPHRGKTPPHGRVTIYKNIKYRSTYEAKFAEYLDKQNLTFNYEPKRFILHSGETYVPDFFVDEWNTFVEIKGWFGFARTHKVFLFREDYPETPILLLNGKHLNQLYDCGIKGV